MFLIGEEVGVAKDMRYDHILANREDLAGSRNGNGAGPVPVLRDLIRLRLRHGRCGRPRSTSSTFTTPTASSRVPAMERHRGVPGRGQPGEPSFGDGYTIANPPLGRGGWREVFNSDAGRYGGDNVVNSGRVLSANAGRLDVVLPACGVIVLEAQR